MARFKNEKGLTLIELLITISVLAVVSAIALPVINNVVASSNSNALQQTIKDADAFINKYSKSGVVAYDGLTQTFKGYVDTDGDNTIDAGEKIDTLTLDEKYAISVTGSASEGGSYSSGGVTAATITEAGGSSSNASSGPTIVTTSLNAQPASFNLEVIGQGWNQSWVDYLSPSAPVLSASAISYTEATKTVTWTATTTANNIDIWDANGNGFAYWSGSSNSPHVTVTDNGNGTMTFTVDIDGLNPAWTSPVGLSFSAIQGMGPGSMAHMPFTFN